MIAQKNNEGFLAAHWEMFALGAGVLMLIAAAAFAVIAYGDDPEAKADDIRRELDSAKKSGTGVDAFDIAGYRRSLLAMKEPKMIPELPEEAASFLVSGRRVFCAKCEAAIPGSAVKCPLCGEEQPKDEPVVLDSDGDGLPNEWETANGLDPNDPSDGDADRDGDGFSNYEEFMAKTDPNDLADHPDYLDYVRLILPLEETVLPFYFKDVTETPNGLRYRFFDPKRKNDYGKAGTTYAVMEGEEIGDTGFIVRGYEKKEKKVKIRGSEQQKTVDVSEAKIERKGDGKLVPLVVEEKRKPIDVQAKVVFDRGETSEFTVIPGDIIDLNGSKYKVNAINRLAKGASIVLEHVSRGNPRTIETLEP